jgi:hypothetical protein
MKKILILVTLLSSIFLSINVSAGGTYIVNEDGTVTFLKKVAPSFDEASDNGRIYIMNDDGTITFLSRINPSEIGLEQLEMAREDLRHMEDILLDSMK